MRKILVTVAVSGLFLAACAEDQPSVVPPAATGEDACAKENLTLLEPGTLTIGTDIPAYPPWFDTTKPFKDASQIDDTGYEGAVAYAIADRLGFTPEEVTWTPVPFGQSFKPGPKDFDFDINQISYTAKRAESVDFSESYYDVAQALVSVEGNPITGAAGIADLKDYTLATEIGTTSYDYIVNEIAPNEEPGAYNTLNDSIQALKAGQVDGIVVDLPSAFYITAVQVSDGVIVGQFPPAAGGEQEYFGVVFEKGSALVQCVNEAIGELRSEGTLQALEDEWLSSKTDVPVFSS
jgi:polar amino acid transport system substrate-binding protein